MKNIERQVTIIKLVKQGRTQTEVARMFNITRQRVSQIINKEYFPIKRIQCTHCSNIFLKLTPSNKFCIDCSKHLAGFSGRERTREIVRMRDNYTCQKCGLKWDENMRRFDIHHLKGNCGKYSRSYDRFSDIGSLTTLCHKCHMSLKEVRKKMVNKSSPRPNKPPLKSLKHQ